MKARSITTAVIAGIAIVGGGTATALASTGDHHPVKVTPSIKVTPAGKGVKPDFSKVQPVKVQEAGRAIVVDNTGKHITLKRVPPNVTLEKVPAKITPGGWVRG